MTTKADVLAARAEYERVAEAYLVGVERWKKTTSGRFTHEASPYQGREWELDDAIASRLFIWKQALRSPPHDR